MVKEAWRPTQNVVDHSEGGSRPLTLELGLDDDQEYLVAGRRSLDSGSSGRVANHRRLEVFNNDCLHRFLSSGLLSGQFCSGNATVIDAGSPNFGSGNSGHGDYHDDDFGRRILGHR